MDIDYDKKVFDLWKKVEKVKPKLWFPPGAGTAMNAFRGLFARFKVDADGTVFGGAGNAQMGAGIKKLVPGFAGGDINIHFRLGAVGRVGFGIQRGAGR